VDQDLKIEREVNDLLSQRAQDHERFCQGVEALTARYGDAVLVAFFYLTTNMEFSPRAAARHWSQIAPFWRSMGEKIGHVPDVRVAMLDYFLGVNRRIKNPTIIEIKVFQKTQQEVLFDQLTRLYNYRYLMRVLDREISRSMRHHTPLTLVIFDVDNFKRYNDTHGHLSGSRALKKIGQIIRRSLRTSDIPARYGGEEFVALLPETDKKGGEVIAERIRQRVERSSYPLGSGRSARLTISGGVASFDVDAFRREDLLRCADRALYQAKASGKNRIVLYLENRRRFERIALPGEVLAASDVGGVVHNLGLGGLQIRTAQPVPVGSKVSLDLVLPGGSKSLRCAGRVKWMERLPGEEGCLAGVLFTQLNEDQRRSIRAGLESLRKAGAALASGKVRVSEEKRVSPPAGRRDPA
jgi:diguanylate cyclase (GGDEF)-like protein